MAKAYDRIDWTFLCCILLQLGFHQVWVDNIMGYVTAVRYYIRLNRDITEFFTPQRGLQQDDSLLLFEATSATPSIIKDVLTEYETLAGQRVNYNKSELVLSPNTTAAIKPSFMSSLSVAVVDGHNRYLGLPLYLGRKVSSNFLQLLDRAHAKLKPWYTSTLSCGGR
ncbi:hypothetical protein QQ045_015753 [Rhodiola kirilowii]